MTVAARKALFTPIRRFGLVAFAAPLLTIYAPLSLAVVLPLGVLLAIACRWDTGHPWFRLNALPWLPVFGLIALMAVSTVWSFDPAETLGKLARTVAVIALGIAFVTAVTGMSWGDRSAISGYLAAGFAAALALIAIERLTGGLLLPFREMDVDPVRFLNQFNRPLSILAIFVWPVAMRLAQWRPAFAIATVSAFLLLLLAFQTYAAIAAIMFGAMVCAVVYLAPRVGGLIVGGALSLIVVFAPTINGMLPSPDSVQKSLGLPGSSYHRLLIWEFVNGKISERPVMGWGFNASRAIPGNEEVVDGQGAALPLHPHNAALQWRLELGVLGALLGGAIVFAATESARRLAHGRMERAGAIAAAAAAYIVAMLSFGIWQSWWVSALFLAAGFTVLACRGDRSAGS